MIGRSAYRVEADEALDYVFGYTCANDVTARDKQPAKGQWTYAKGFDTFCPLGPVSETAIDDPEKSAEKAEILRSTGAEIVFLPNTQGKVDLLAAMQELARRGINEVHAEAGGKLNGSLLRSGLVDEFLFYFAPCLLGHDAAGLFHGPALTSLADKQPLKIHDIRQIGSDIRVITRPV